jgi:hypothetical protein
MEVILYYHYYIRCIESREYVALGRKYVSFEATLEKGDFKTNSSDQYSHYWRFIAYFALL